MKESRLGKSVANLKKNRDYRVIDLATKLLEKWRKILTDERRAKQADEGLGMVKKKRWGCKLLTQPVCQALCP